jgi:chemotaxis protein methyltransferase CheR
VNPSGAPIDLERFRAAVTQRLGLYFDDAKLGFLGEVLQQRIGKLGRTGDSYLRSLENEPVGEELAALAEELTVTETYFFRNKEQYHALAEIVLPRLTRQPKIPRILNLLSAGCASGEEPYSLAIVARESIADRSWDVRIRAVDLNPAVLAKARSARYSAWALRDTPAEIQQKWFRPEGRELVLLEPARAGVTFEPRNLAAEDPELWQPAIYDVVFCRNVMMYFSPQRMRSLIARISESLMPGGFLFLGHAETLRGLSDDFHLRHTHDTFYYERKETAARDHSQPMGQAAPGVSSPPLLAFNEAWFDSIRQASERVAALTPAGIPAQLLEPSPPVWDMAAALDLLHRERFGEALAYVRTLPPGADKDPDILLLEAMLLAHNGQLSAAEKVCLRLLEIDELNAGAHYTLALCHESAGDLAEAAEHDRVAIYLDPAFAMPRLHLGLLARRSGKRESARRELGHALILLKREDGSRLLLFGGGFNRGALISLCESALRDCGGRP